MSSYGASPADSDRPPSSHLIKRQAATLDIAAFLLLVSHPSQIVWTAIFPLKTVNRDYRPAQPESCPEELATWVEHGLFDQLVCAQQLMISSNLVGCWTGRSEGLAPFKILST